MMYTTFAFVLFQVYERPEKKITYRNNMKPPIKITDNAYLLDSNTNSFSVYGKG